MGGAQIVHTVCMDTRDATQRKDGEFAMKLGGDNPRFQAVKVALGSLEFPMVQWSIEEQWNRIYFSEGYRLGPTSSVLRLQEQTDDETVFNDVVVQLPLHINHVVEITGHSRGTRVRTEHPHALWVDGRRCVLDAIDWAEVELLCTAAGRVSLTELKANGKLHYLSEREFIVADQSFDCAREGGGVLHSPPYPSPSALCATIAYVLAYADALANYDCRYDARENRATLQATMFPPDCNTLTLRLYGSELATLLGYPSAVHERRFHRKRAPDNFQDPTRAFDFYAQNGDIPPLSLTSEPFAGWTYVELEPGWYAPSHRPMCTGQPLRLTQELEAAFNRLHFPVPERIPNGMATSHFLMFTDPAGSLHNCPVYAGRYTPDAFSAHLELEMSSLSSVPGTVFTVEYDDEEQRFNFMCEVRDRRSGTVRPAPFGLILNHPAQFDPSKIGFAPAALYGRDSYSSTCRVVISTSRGTMRAASNLYKVTEVGHQKRLRLQPQPPSSLTCIIAGYDVDTDVLTMRTYAGQLPFAHGLQEGDVVQLAPSESTNELYRYENGTWSAASVGRAPIAASWGRSGVVIAHAACDTFGSDCIEVAVRVRPTRDLVNHIGQTIALQAGVEPFNLCIGLPRSIGATHLGFPRGATQWGIDGATPSGRLMVPPFEAPAVHALDHPDYILIYLSEGKLSSGLQHQFGANSTSPFAKLVLYPMFREERMLPRETTLLSGENLASFTMKFTNPDGTPYQFHGAQFSFSLNFIKVQEG